MVHYIRQTDLGLSKYRCVFITGPHTGLQKQWIVMLLAIFHHRMIIKVILKHSKKSPWKTKSNKVCDKFSRPLILDFSCLFCYFGPWASFRIWIWCNRLIANKQSIDSSKGTVVKTVKEWERKKEKEKYGQREKVRFTLREDNKSNRFFWVSGGLCCLALLWLSVWDQQKSPPSKPRLILLMWFISNQSSLLKLPVLFSKNNVKLLETLNVLYCFGHDKNALETLLDVNIVTFVHLTFKWLVRVISKWIFLNASC